MNKDHSGSRTVAGDLFDNLSKSYLQSQVKVLNINCNSASVLKNCEFSFDFSKVDTQIVVTF